MHKAAAANAVAIAAAVTGHLLLLLSMLLLGTLRLEDGRVHGATVGGVLECADVAVRVAGAHQTSVSGRGLARREGTNTRRHDKSVGKNNNERIEDIVVSNVVPFYEVNDYYINSLLSFHSLFALSYLLFSHKGFLFFRL